LIHFYKRELENEGNIEIKKINANARRRRRNQCPKKRMN